MDSTGTKLGFDLVWTKEKAQVSLIYSQVSLIYTQSLQYLLRYAIC